MKFTSAAIILLAIVTLGPGPRGVAQNQQGPNPGQWQPPPPPSTWTSAEHFGYMMGVQAAWADLADHLAPKPSRHLDYLHPKNVKLNRRYQYREGFRKGYRVVYQHMRGAYPHRTGSQASPAQRPAATSAAPPSF